jgi:hypothetical protein
MPRKALDRSQFPEIMRLLRENKSWTEIRKQLGVSEYAIIRCRREYGVQRHQNIPARPGSRGYTTGGKLQLLPLALRFHQVRDIEHTCRCYVNAYVADLEGKQSHCSRTLAELRDQQWIRLLEQMFSVLVQEGMIEQKQDKQEEDNEA